MTVRVKGLDEFRRELRQLDRRFGKAFAEANLKVSKRTVDAARPKVRALRSPGGTIALPGIKTVRSQKSAKIKLDSSYDTLFANVFGTLSHTVFGRTKPGSGPWLPWVGQSWQPEELHGVGPAIREVADGFALDTYMDAVMDAVSRAFPD